MKRVLSLFLALMLLLSVLPLSLYAEKKAESNEQKTTEMQEKTDKTGNDDKKNEKQEEQKKSESAENTDKLVRSKYIDVAFSCLEEDNIFLKRYNELTGADVKVKFKAGIPYFFGGQDAKLVFSRYPDYKKRQMWEDTRFYRKGKIYIYGFDCSGFTRYVNMELGKEKHAKLTSLINASKYAENRIYGTKENKPMPAYNELYKHLKVGDMLVAKHRARHIMIYIGTLRQFGFTAEQLPELKDYLDYPLVVHSGPNPFYGPRFQSFIDNGGDYYKRCNTTNGGVCVSIVGVPTDKAPNHAKIGAYEFDWFEIGSEKYQLTIYDLPSSPEYCWFRY